jgi:hypothetical protein
MLAQQPGCLQRIACLLRQPSGLQLHAQRQRAPGCALRQALEPGHCRERLAVVQRPARRAHQDALAGLLRIARRCMLQRLLQMLFSRRPVLQCLRAFGGQQVGQGAHLRGVASGLAAVAERSFLAQRRFGRLARADEAASQHVRDRVQQGSVHGPLLLLRAPAQRLARQVEQRRQRP